VTINESLFLTAHPDLEFSTQKNNGVSLFLLGFILDPYNPADTNDDILRKLLKTCNSFEDVTAHTAHYGGRFVIIYDGFGETKLFHDPAGFRQIFYCNDKNSVWCASQPHLLAHELNIRQSEDQDLLNFLRSGKFMSGRTEHAWPGEDTIYEGISHLLPNHYLDLSSGLPERYWPNAKISEIPCDEAVPISAQLLQGLLKSAHNRYKLTLAVTSGWDSRVLLAASKPIKEDIFYFILKNKKMNNRHKDIKVPQKLFSRLGLKFNVIECDGRVDERFREIILKNVCFYQSEIKIGFYYNFFKHFQGTVTLGGNMGELARRHYDWAGNVSAEKLAACLGYRGDIFVIKNCSDWLKDAQAAADKSNIDLLDLFYWEQRMGNWGAMYPSELDIAIEELHPFNCRKLFLTMLSVNKVYRKRYDSVLYKRLISYMWPEVLREPIYPPSYVGKAKSVLRALIEKILE